MEIKNLHYNAAVRAFQGLVCLTRNGHLIEMPASVPAPISMDPRRVNELISSRAMRKIETATF